MKQREIEVQPIAGALGAELVGVDVAGTLDDAAVAQIRAAVVRHGVVVLREQKLAREQQLAFARRLGRPEVHPIANGMDEHPEIIRVTCDLHSWMRGWVVVADHPFYALTDGGGAFELRGLPAGRYTLKVWQERLGTTSKDVVVGDQEPTAVTLEMAAR